MHVQSRDTYDLESVGNDADSHELLAVVAAVHHERVGQALDDGALSLAETLGGIATGGVREVDRGADLDVVAVKFDSWSANLILDIRGGVFLRAVPRFPIAIASSIFPAIPKSSVEPLSTIPPRGLPEQNRMGLEITYVKEMSLISTSS